MEIGKIIYDLLDISEPDIFHWDRNSYRNHAGMRFASNIISIAINDSNQIVIADYQFKLNISARESYKLNVKNFIKEYPHLHLKDLLLKIFTEFNRKKKCNEF
ncbi:MAG: hypothetical protein ACXABO_07425 [Promethearchaeota archaeon]